MNERRAADGSDDSLRDWSCFWREISGVFLLSDLSPKKKKKMEEKQKTAASVRPDIRSGEFIDFHGKMI